MIFWYEFWSKDAHTDFGFMLIVNKIYDYPVESHVIQVLVYWNRFCCVPWKREIMQLDTTTGRGVCILDLQLRNCL